jgi:transposase
VIDELGNKLETSSFEHSYAGISGWIDHVVELAAGEVQSVAVAIETPHHAIVEMLVERGIPVFSINPKQLDRFRDRHTVAGAKDDRRDAYVLGDALRTDQQRYRRVQIPSEQTLLLRELGRAHRVLTEELTSLGNRIEELLVRFFPQTVGLGSAHADLWFINLLERFPSPSAARACRPEDLAPLRCRREKKEAILAALGQPEVHVAPGLEEAMAIHLRSLIARWRTTAAERKAMAARLEAALGPVPATNDRGADRLDDAAIIRSMPGAGVVVTAALLGEAHEELAERNYAALRCVAGVAPVTKRSGRAHHVVRRHACRRRLGDALHHWAFGAIRFNADLRAAYRAYRQRGVPHGGALRRIGDKLLRILIARLRAGQAFQTVLAA